MLKRRHFNITLGLGLIGCGAEPPLSAAPANTRAPLATPATTAAPACESTPSDIEGPYYLDGAPAKELLGTEGRTLKLEGVVRDCEGHGVANVIVDVWHADEQGAYDLEGYSMRGKVTTDSVGRYRLQTIVPGRYALGESFRPRHVHIKLHRGGEELLTTQLYFPHDPYNASDPFMKPELLMEIEEGADEDRGSFDFQIG